MYILAPGNRQPLVSAEELQEQTITWMCVSFLHKSWSTFSFSLESHLHSYLSYILLMW
jgi:hypothetical protein